MINLPTFKCRASKIGDIMTNGRGKNAGMGETAKTYAKEWVIQQITGKQKTIESKYLSHGIYAEEAAIQRAEKHFGCKFPRRQEYKENNFFTGSFDAANDAMVIDTKCSFNEYTFPYFQSDPDKKYYGQLQVYMDLHDVKNAALVFCLENHSDDEIDKMAQRLAYNEGLSDPEMEHWNEAKKQLTFDHLPDSMRIKVYEFTRDDEYLVAAKQRVNDVEDYITNELVPVLRDMGV